MIAMLDPQWKEYFDERAGILEFDCGIERTEAEDLAWRQTSAAMLKHKAERARRAA
jgi:hypothetical protein